MNRMRILLTGLSVLCAASMLFAQTSYYVSPGGNDRNDGRSPSTPWKTLNKVNASRFRPGDRILLERGGTWWEELRPPSSGDRKAPIVFGSYGRGRKPVIDAGGTLAGWDEPDRWTEVEKNIWQFQSNRFPGRLWLSGCEYGVSGTEKGRGTTTPNARYRWWGSSDGIIEVYSQGNPAQAYHAIDVADEGRYAMTIRNKEWLTFAGIEFRRGEICIDVENGDHLVFDSCTVLGGTAKYGLWLRGGSDDGIIRNSLFDREDTVQHAFEFTGEAGNANGQDNIAMQWANRWDIHHNRIANPGHDAISLSGERAGSEVWRSCGNRIHDNEVWMVGDYGRFTSTNAKGDPSWCADNEFYGNDVHDMTVQSQMLGRNNVLHDNLFRRYRKIPFDNLHYRSCVIDLSDYLTPAGEGIRVWHNTFVDCDAHAISISAGTRYASIRYNLIVNTGKLTGVGGHDFLDHVGIVVWPGAETDTIKDNVIWCSGKEPIVYQQPGWNANVKRSVRWFNEQNGDRGNVIAGNVSVDPKLDARWMPTVKVGVGEAGVRRTARGEYRE